MDINEPSLENIIEYSQIDVKQETIDPSDTSSTFGNNHTFQSEVDTDIERDSENEKVNENPVPVKCEPDVDDHDDDITEHSSSLIYRCKYCGQQLQKIETLLQHEDAHRDGTIYKCRYCEYYTIQRERIKAHERKHTGEKPYCCDLCDYRASSQGDVTRHALIHSSDRRFKCTICPFRSKLASGLRKHMKAHSDHRPFSCDKCDARFKRKFSLENHLRLHSSDKPFRCDICNYTCKTRNLLRGHEKTHSDVRNFPCNHQGCEQRCKTRSDLIKHMAVHMTSLDFKCVLCDKLFKSRQSLLVHTRRHVQKEFPCEECGQVLRSKQGLSRHLSLHFDEKKYNCQVCGHKFSHVSNLKIHLRVHDELRTFQCPLCVSGYKTANHLFTHIGSAHGKSYVYFCEVCHKPFSRYLMIKTHIDKNHKDINTGQDSTDEFVYNKECCVSSEIKNQNSGEIFISNIGHGIDLSRAKMNSLIIQKELEHNEPTNLNLIENPIKTEGQADLSLSMKNDETPQEEVSDSLERRHFEGSDSETVNSNYENQTMVNSIIDNQTTKDSDRSILRATSLINHDKSNLDEQAKLVDLCSRELVIKLERLPTNHVTNRQLSSDQCTEDNFDRIIKIGSYASVGIYLAGRNSGMKFNLKRGKKSSFSKWFMNPNNMTCDAAEKTKKYLKKQVKLSQRKAHPKSKKKLNGEKKFPRVALKSTSFSKSQRKKSSMKTSCRKKGNIILPHHSSLIEGKSFVKTEMDFDFEQFTDQTLSHHSKEDNQGSSENDEEQLCHRVDHTDTVGKSYNKNGLSNSNEKAARRKQKMNMTTVEPNEISSSGLRKVTDVKAIALLGQSSETVNDISSALNVDPFSVEKSVKLQSQPASTRPQTSVVLGVEKVINSPIRITWKKVGCNMKKARLKTQSYNGKYSSEKCERINGDNDFGQEDRNNELSIYSENKKRSPICCDIVTDKDSVINQTISHHMIRHRERVKHEQEQNHYLDPQNNHPTRVAQDEASKSSVGFESQVRVLSLQEFEEEYRQRSKIVATVSFDDGEIDRNSRQSAVVNKKMKKGITRKRGKGKKGVKPLDGSDSIQLHPFSRHGKLSMDCTVVRKANEETAGIPSQTNNVETLEKNPECFALRNSEFEENRLKQTERGVSYLLTDDDESCKRETDGCTNLCNSDMEGINEKEADTGSLCHRDLEQSSSEGQIKVSSVCSCVGLNDHPQSATATDCLQNGKEFRTSCVQQSDGGQEILDQLFCERRASPTTSLNPNVVNAMDEFRKETVPDTQNLKLKRKNPFKTIDKKQMKKDSQSHSAMSNGSSAKRVKLKQTKLVSQDASTAFFCRESTGKKKLKSRTQDCKSSAECSSNKRVKLPGLLSDDFVLRRQTVECVTLLPKVCLTNLSTKSSYHPSPRVGHIFKENEPCPCNLSVAVNVIENNECDAENPLLKIETGNLLSDNGNFFVESLSQPSFSASCASTSNSSYETCVTNYQLETNNNNATDDQNTYFTEEKTQSGINCVDDKEKLSVCDRDMNHKN